MEYRQSESGCIYRQGPTINEVLTPFGWQPAVFMLGACGWREILRISKPVAIHPAWPA